MHQIDWVARWTRIFKIVANRRSMYTFSLIQYKHEKYTDELKFIDWSQILLYINCNEYHSNIIGTFNTQVALNILKHERRWMRFQLSIPVIHIIIKGPVNSLHYLVEFNTASMLMMNQCFRRMLFITEEWCVYHLYFSEPLFYGH